MYCRIKTLTENNSIRECASRLGISPVTVHKYAQMDMKEANQYFTNRRRRSQFDRALGFILDKLEEDHRISAVKLHRKIKERHPEIEAGVRAFRDYLRPLKESFRNEKIRHYEPVLDMLPGKQMQVDGGEIQASLSGSDEHLKVYFWVFVLSYSRMMFVNFQARPYNTSDFIKAHIQANNFFGGIAEEYVYDQTKLVAISEQYREVLYNNDFYQFAMRCGFTPHVCEGYDPESKGKVERAVGYVKDSFFCGDSFTGIEHIRTEGIEWLNNIANVRIHATTRRKPIDMFREEKKHLLKANFMEVTKINIRAVDKTGLISFRGNKYSVPFEYQRKQVFLKVEERILKIYDLKDHEQIASHAISLAKGDIIINNNHYRNFKKTIGQLLEETEKAFFDIAFSELIISRVRQQNPKIIRDQLRGLQKLRRQYSTAVWNKAVDTLKDLPVLSCSRIKKALERVKNKQQLPTMGNNSNALACLYAETDRTIATSSLDRPLESYLRGGSR